MKVVVLSFTPPSAQIGGTRVVAASGQKVVIKMGKDAGGVVFTTRR